MNITDTINKALLKIGYETIEGGRFTFSEWARDMKEAFQINLQGFLRLSDAEIDPLLVELWHTDYKKDEDCKPVKDWAESIQKNTEIYQEGMAKLDRLFKLIKKYHSSKFFKELLQFSAKFKELSPYNLMLVKTQMPSARYVLTAPQWKAKYDRKPKEEARPLIILRKYGPISFVFEIGDTEPYGHYVGNLFGDDIQMILNQLASPYAVTGGKVDDRDYERLMRRLVYNGIKKEKFRVAASYGAMIRRSVDTVDVMIPSNNKLEKVSVKTYYKIFVNERADKSEEFASVCHELGHLFCHHLSPFNSEAWKLRVISHDEEEFEAECVSYIVCDRHGVENRSWTYLSNFLDQNDEVPNISFDRVFRAADAIEAMLSDQEEEPTKGLLYRFDKEYKKKIDAIL